MLKPDNNIIISHDIVNIYTCNLLGFLQCSVGTEFRYILCYGDSGTYYGGYLVLDVGGTVNENRSSPMSISPVCYSVDQNGADSTPERQLENPIYGEDELTHNTYTVAFEQQNQRSLTNHKFDSPVYGIGDSTTYEVPCDANSLASL